MGPQLGDDDWLDQALAYATQQPDNGISGPLTRVRIRARPGHEQGTGPGGSPGEGPVYRLADYLDQYGRRDRQQVIPPPGFWAAAVHGEHADIPALADSAYRRCGLLCLAAQLDKQAAPGASQVAQAESDLATAQATANNARIQADRYSGLVKSNAVSQQDTDTFVNQATATASTVKSAEANLQRLRELQSFEKVYAPFDGVVTARAVDTGELISSGSGQGAGTELFHMQALQTLRVYTNVPQIFSETMKRGMKVAISFPEYPGKTFEGTLVRTADAIDPASRTLLVEIDLDNRSGKLMPGSLAQVHFKAPTPSSAFIVPTSALIFRREGMQVATVTDGSDGTVAHLVPVIIGEDDGATVEIINGLNSSDRVIQDPPDSLIEGEKVTLESSQSSAFGAGGL